MADKSGQYKYNLLKLAAKIDRFEDGDKGVVAWTCVVFKNDKGSVDDLRELLEERGLARFFSEPEETEKEIKFRVWSDTFKEKLTMTNLRLQHERLKEMNKLRSAGKSISAGMVVCGEPVDVQDLSFWAERGIPNPFYIGPRGRGGRGGQISI